ncbi:MAG: tannase/feruloyl esterase family alpha/beta hydrolase [Pseudomonadota bacterium]
MNTIPRHTLAAMTAALSAAALCGCGSHSDSPNPAETAGAATVATAPGSASVPCASLKSLNLPDTIITSAEAIPAGSYKPPGSDTTYDKLPAFCRVLATTTPVPGSSIKLEVWLPSTTWNGKYQQSGSHGFAGTLFWGEMAPQLQRGYATGITDDGHTPLASGFDVSWAFGYPERIVDFAWRGVHELAVKSKLLIAAYYGRPQQYAYFHGCSDGGREGMKSAQLFPKDFDGIIIGGTAAYWTPASTQLLQLSKNLMKAGIQGSSGAAILTRAQNAATAACDGNDGVVDGIINNPSMCKWDPATLVCKAGQDPETCITAQQADAIKANLAPVLDPATRKWVHSGMAIGSEFEQIRRGWHNGINKFGLANYQMAFNNPGWDSSTFDLATDMPLLDSKLAVINAIDPDLTPFQKAGGKLIQWHGWSDSSFTPGWTVDYYRQVVERTGRSELENVQDFYRLFMLPGVGHCGTGVGPDNIGAENQAAVSRDPEHDIVSALEAWVEKGVAPHKLIATKFNGGDPGKGIAMQRPICPYPNEAIYRGSGNTNDASNFYCGKP